jgi:hypothetical protein
MLLFLFSYAVLLITPMIIAMMAITNKIWMIPPVKNPPRKEIAQIIINITAITYNMFPFIFVFKDYCKYLIRTKYL